MSDTPSAYAAMLRAADAADLTEAEFLARNSGNGQRAPGKRRKLKVLTIQDIRNFADPTFLVDNVLIAGTITLLGSYAGKGKTILALSLMRSILDGFPWLGRYSISRSGPVLLINEESPDSVLKVYTAKVDPEQPFYLLHFQDVRIDTKSGCEELIDVIREIDPVFIVIDSLIRIHGHQEDSSVEMAVVIKSLRQIANGGGTILLLHHHNKGTGSLETRARGSSDIPASVDLELSLYEKGERLILQSVKSRFRPFEPVALEIYDEDGIPDIKLAISIEDEVRGAIRECAQGEPVDFATIKDHVESQGIDIGTQRLRNIVNSMEELREKTQGKHHKKVYSLLTLSIASQDGPRSEGQ